MADQPHLPPYDSFHEACEHVLEFLHEHLGFGLWMVTRTESDDWIVLVARDTGYGVGAGDVLKWSDSYCSRMVRGEGPQIAPQSGAIPAYATAPIGKQVRIGAYVGIPIEDADGNLFGTLCAIDPAEQADSIREKKHLIETQARMLSTILRFELQKEELNRQLEISETSAQQDALTGVLNRNGWERRVAAEEDRCRRYGSPAACMVIDLDGFKNLNDVEGHHAGDDLLRRAAETLQATTRTSDIVARIGGDEFAILLIETSAEQADHAVRRVRDVLDENDIQASVGFAVRDPRSTIGDALKDADARMYVEKRARKNGRAAA